MTILDEKDVWRTDFNAAWPSAFTFVAFTQVIVSPALYGASLFMMKEEDMALTARTHHKVGTPGYQHVPTHTLQAQLI